MYLFIEKLLRGGISYIARRYAKANNKYMRNYDPAKPSKFITYLVMNNLYGQAMNRYLPYGRGESFPSLLVACYFLLVACYFCSLLVTFYSLLGKKF